MNPQYLSPELALVDPELARAARIRLPDLPGRGFGSPVTSSARPAAVQRAAARPLDAEEQDAQTSRRAVIAVATITMVAVLLVDIRVEVGRMPASATTKALETTAAPAVEMPAQPAVQPPPEAAQTPPRAKQEPRATPSRKAPSVHPPRRDPTLRPVQRAATQRRFAWAPSEGATGYYVEFFLGSTRVYARRTTRPALEVPPRWRYRGLERNFAPGTYRWYVWPVVDGKRASRAAVQTTVTIPNS
jgi:hypothetical protein